MQNYFAHIISLFFESHDRRNLLQRVPQNLGSLAHLILVTSDKF